MPSIALIFALEIWLIMEAIAAFRRLRAGLPGGSPEEKGVYDVTGAE